MLCMLCLLLQMLTAGTVTLFIEAQEEKERDRKKGGFLIKKNIRSAHPRKIVLSQEFVSNHTLDERERESPLED